MSRDSATLDNQLADEFLIVAIVPTTGRQYAAEGSFRTERPVDLPCTHTAQNCSSAQKSCSQVGFSLNLLKNRQENSGAVFFHLLPLGEFTLCIYIKKKKKNIQTLNATEKIKPFPASTRKPVYLPASSGVVWRIVVPATE